MKRLAASVSWRFPPRPDSTNRTQRLHDALCALRLHVFVREREWLSPPGLDPQPAGHRRSGRLTLLRVLYREVEVGHGISFDVRPTDQRAAEQIDLLTDVGLDREPRHQRAQNRLGIDVDARRTTRSGSGM